MTTHKPQVQLFNYEHCHFFSNLVTLLLVQPRALFLIITIYNIDFQTNIFFQIVKSVIIM